LVDELTEPEPGQASKIARVWLYVLESDWHFANQDVAVGIDPGATTAVVVALPRARTVKAYLVKMPASRVYEDGRLGRLRDLFRLLQDDEVFNGAFPEEATAVVEDAAFYRPHGQVALAESRTAAVFRTAAVLALAAARPRWKWSLVNPRTLRSKVLGHGGKKPLDVWCVAGDVQEDILDAYVAACSVGLLEKKGQ